MGELKCHVDPAAGSDKAMQAVVLFSTPRREICAHGSYQLVHGPYYDRKAAPRDGKDDLTASQRRDRDEGLLSRSEFIFRALTPHRDKK
jgi:hypothetical protein